MHRFLLVIPARHLAQPASNLLGSWLVRTELSECGSNVARISSLPLYPSAQAQISGTTSNADDEEPDQERQPELPILAELIAARPHHHAGGRCDPDRDDDQRRGGVASSSASRSPIPVGAPSGLAGCWASSITCRRSTSASCASLTAALCSANSSSTLPWQTGPGIERRTHARDGRGHCRRRAPSGPPPAAVGARASTSAVRSDPKFSILPSPERLQRSADDRRISCSKATTRVSGHP